MDRIEKIREILDKHRKDAMITCEEDCPCWQIETLLSELDQARERVRELESELTEFQEIETTLDSQIKELEELQFVYNNTPFAHWVDRAKKAEAKLAEAEKDLKHALKDLNSRDSAKGKLFVALKERLAEATKILNHVNLQFPLEDYGLDVLEDVREFLKIKQAVEGK